LNSSKCEKGKEKTNANANILARNYKVVRITLQVIMEINTK